MDKLKVKIISNIYTAEDLLPEYKTEGSAGMDLKAAVKEEIILKPGERKLIPAGIAISLGNKKTVALIYSRSGLATKHGIGLANGVGVVDSDYRGEIFCPLINLSDRDFTLKPLERMAQLIIAPVHIMDIDVVEDLDTTVRGSGGFGHTGR
ncbi:MAG: dUTP diphosphatase [Firmicutes bacterium]|nr:dUTP diphosphatase [Bacillota bacterium]